MQPQDNSGVNTILIVLLIVGVVAFGSWYVYGQNKPANEKNDMNINVELPSPGGDAPQPAGAN